jgi:hypothetical protein
MSVLKKMNNEVRDERNIDDNYEDDDDDDNDDSIA